MWTVSGLARACKLSRSTVLYYEAEGLLTPARRSEANYRLYGQPDLEQLRQICAWRKAGLPVSSIKDLLHGGHTSARAILTKRLLEIDAEIEQLRGCQRAIFILLQSQTGGENIPMNKEKWVSIMRDTGFTETDMRKWHMQFEKAAPDDHQQFLEYLHIVQDEIAAIRAWSRAEEA